MGAKREEGKTAMIKPYFKNFWPAFEVSFPKGVGIIFYCWVMITGVGGLGKENLKRIRDKISR